MIDRSRLTRDLVRDEGLRLNMYRCPAGHMTIGVGHNLEARPISERAAMLILADDIQDILAEVQAQDWWGAVEQDEVRARVLVEMAFNLGVPRLNGFTRMLAAVRQWLWDAAADEMVDSAWYTQVGVRAQRLEVMMRTGRDIAPS